MEGLNGTDVDVRFEPESDALLRELAGLKERLGIDVELASPPDFIPELPGWRERSPFVFRDGNVDVHHFDPYSQALSKIERGFVHHTADVEAMLERGLVDRVRLGSLYRAIEPELYRYTAIDPAAFTRKVYAVLGVEGLGLPSSGIYECPGNPGFSRS